MVGNYTIDAITAGGNVTLNVVSAGDTATMVGVLHSTNGGLIKNGNGTLILQRANVYNGPTLLNQGYLIVEADGALGSIVGSTTVANGATLGFEGGINYHTPELIIINGFGVSGTAGAINSFGGNNTFAGPITQASASDIENTGSINTTFKLTGPIDNGGFLLTASASATNTLELSGVIGDSGGLLTNGSGIVKLDGSSSNTYGGLTEVASGTLELAKTGGAIAVPHDLQIDNSATGITVRFDASNQTASTSNVILGNKANLNLQTFNDTIHNLIFGVSGVSPVVATLQGSGNLIVGGNIGNSSSAITSATLNEKTGTDTANLQLGSGNHTVNVLGATSNLTITTPISGAGNLIMAGPGFLTLNNPVGPNTYTGTTTINGGAIIVVTNGALGATSGGTQVNSNGQLLFLATAAPLNYSIAEPITLNGGAVNTAAGTTKTVTFAGPVSVIAPSSSINNTNGTSTTFTLTGNINLFQYVLTLSTATGDTLELSGVISGTGGLTETGSGLVKLDGTNPNTFTGLTTVSGGTLDLIKTNGPAVPGDLSAGPGTVVNLQANNQTAPTTNVTLNNAVFNVGFIPSPGVTDTIASLTLIPGTVQIGAGGILKLNGDVTVGGASNSVIQGTGSLDLNGGIRTFTVSAPRTLTITAPVIGAVGSGLIFTGGTMVFGGTVTNTYQGPTTVLNGTLDLNSTGVSIPGNLTIGDGIGAANTAVVNASHTNDIAAISVVTINSDGLLNLNGFSQSISGLIGTGNLSGGTGPLTNTLTVTVAPATSYTFGGVISGMGLAFIKAGPGTEVLSGTNTYTGSTTINAGELEVDGRIGNGPVTVNSSGILGGTGTITGATTVNSGGEVDPGTAGGGVGTLNVASLLFKSGSIYHVDIGLSAAGAFINDDLRGGSIAIQTGGTAQLQLAPPFAGYSGLSIDIAHSTAAYGGLFAFGATPLVEGGTFTLDSTHYTITYVGAPGHDVILTAHRNTDVWTGAGDNSDWSNPKNWAGNVVPRPGDALEFPANAQRKYNIDDLPAGFEVGEIDFTGTGGGYGISGNSIVLDAGVQDRATGDETLGLEATLNYTSFWINSGSGLFTDTRRSTWGRSRSTSPTSTPPRGPLSPEPSLVRTARS